MFKPNHLPKSTKCIHSYYLQHFKGNGTAVVEMLLNAGADLSGTTAWGDTAAHYAALSGTCENLQFLVEAGISISKNTELGEQARKLCQKFELPEVRMKLSTRYFVISFNVN